MHLAPSPSLRRLRNVEKAGVIDRYVAILDREAAGCPVYASRDWHPLDTTHFKTAGGPWPVHCVAGSAGAARPALIISASPLR